MRDPVSWLVIERGWSVVGSDGEELGKVDEVAGDGDKDIFNGIVVSRGMLRSRRYIPSEQVTSITEGVVHVRLDEARFQKLDEFDEPPPSEQILAP
jgi:hypothetical protein